MKLSKILSIAAVALAAIAFLVALAFPILTLEKDAASVMGSLADEWNTNGINAMFGLKFSAFGVSEKIFEFSIKALIVFIIGAAGVACTVVAFLGKGPKWIGYVAAGCLVVFAIALFIPHYIVNGTEGATAKDVAELYQNGWAAWVGAIFAILGAGCVVAKDFVK